MPKQIVKYNYLLCLVVLMFFSINVDAQEKQQDSPKPFISITNAKLNQQTSKEGDIVEYSFTLTDIGTWRYTNQVTGEGDWFSNGVYEVDVVWKSVDKQTFTKTYTWNKEVSEKNALRVLKVSDNIHIQKGMQSGKWKIGKIILVDQPRENEAHGKTEVHELYVYDFEDKNIINESEDVDFVDLSFADFEVQGTKADNDAPRISVLKLSKKYLKWKQKSIFSLKAKDYSKIAEVKSIWYISKRKGNIEYTMKYNRKKKRYECKVKLPSKNVKKMRLMAVYVRDVHGNEMIYENGEFTKSKAIKKAIKKTVVYKR